MLASFITTDKILITSGMYYYYYDPEQGQIQRTQFLSEIGEVLGEQQWWRQEKANEYLSKKKNGNSKI